MVINVHAGHNPHGKVACGAVGLISESLENRRVKDLVIDELRRMGHTVYDCTVENGLTQSDVLTKIVKKANAHSVDLDLSIHFNASSSAAANGAEAWVYNDKSKAVDKANDILNAICSLGFKNRGVKKSEKLYFLRKTKAPAVIIECCFVGSEKDVSLYNVEEMAAAIVYGITGSRCIGTDESEKTLKKDEDDVAEITGVGKIYRVCVLDQKGAFHNAQNAANLKAALEKSGYNVLITES